MNDFLSATNLGNIEHPNCVPREDHDALKAELEDYRTEGKEYRAEIARLEVTIQNLERQIESAKNTFDSISRDCKKLLEELR